MPSRLMRADERFLRMRGKTLDGADGVHQGIEGLPDPAPARITENLG
jgi:hypothetical protein